MPTSVYIAPFDAETGDVPAPPTTDPEGGLQLRYTDVEGRVRGGRADASAKPPAPGVPTVMLVVDADAATHAALRADPRFCWVEDRDA